MKQVEFNDFCDLLSLVAEQYGKPVSEGAMMLYFQGLIDYDFNAVKQALFRHIRNPDNGMFMPKIADIVKMLQGSTQDSALLAWTKVDKAIRCVGCDTSVVFDDPLIHRVLQDMGGWTSFRMILLDEMPFKAREFEQRYRGYKSRNEKPDYATVLIGVFDSINAEKNYETDKPVFIGNVELAKQVMLGGTNKPAIQISHFNQAVRQLAS